MNSDIAREIARELTRQGFHRSDGLYTSRQQEEIICNNIQRAIDQSTASLKAEIERLKHERNKAGMEERNKYLPKLAQLTAEKEEAEAKCAERDRAIWRAALTLAHNLCVQDSDRINDDDGPMAAIHALSDEAKRIKAWLEPSDEQLAEMFTEAGVPSTAGHNYINAEKLKGVVENVELVHEALRYGGVGDDRPLNRLILLIEAERSKHIGDHWDFWNFLSEKLQAAELATSQALSQLRELTK